MTSPNSWTQELHPHVTHKRTVSTVCVESDDGCLLYWMGIDRVIYFKDSCSSSQSLTLFCRSLHLQNETNGCVRDRGASCTGRAMFPWAVVLTIPVLNVFLWCLLQWFCSSVWAQLFPCWQWLNGRAERLLWRPLLIMWLKSTMTEAHVA